MERSAFYATFDWPITSRRARRTAAYVAQTLQPDYMVVLEEPGTEATTADKPT